MTAVPRHGRGQPGDDGRGIRRLPVIAAVVVVLVGVGLIAASVGVPSDSGPAGPSPAVAAAAPVDAQSSTWFCTGGSGTSTGIANATLSLVNIGSRPVDGTVTVVDTAASTASRAVVVPARGQLTVVPSTIEPGPWLASRVELDGGGVTVNEIVSGPAGWAQSACSTTTSSTWFFASGSTTDGNTLYVSLFNPTATAAVVDLGFVTSQGLTEPQPFEGILVNPGRLVVAGVASFVQDQKSIGTIVMARSGRVVAEALQEHVVNGVSGLSLRLGAPSPAGRWYLPRTVDVTGGSSALTVLNPTDRPEQVTVHVQLGSGPVAPFTDSLPADSSWTLPVSSASRVPANTTYAVEVTATGGPGVVVDRTVQSSSAGAVPQWGTVTAVSDAGTTAPSGRWIVPSPLVATTPPVAGIGPLALNLQNTGIRDVIVTVYRSTPEGLRRLAGVSKLRIPPGVFTVIEQDVLAQAGSDALVLEADGPLAAMEEGVPAGVPGAVALAAIPQT